MNGRSIEKFSRELGDSVVPGRRVVRTDEVARVGVPHTHSVMQPAVEVIRDGDIVKAIDVKCSCGETIRVWCSYESTPQSNAQ